MLNEEEKKAIKYLKNFTEYTKQISIDENKINGKTTYQKDLEHRVKNFETVLNLITKLQKENKTIVKLNANMSKRHLNDIFKIKKLQKENEEKDNIIKKFENECRKFKAFCKKVRKYGHNVDLFNQGQEHKCNQFLNLINGEQHWDYEGKYFDETDKEIQKLAKEKNNIEK